MKLHRELNAGREPVGRIAKDQPQGFVRSAARTNGTESFWSLFKSGHYGICDHLSVQQLRRYLAEFSGRQSVRDADTTEQIWRLARGLGSQRLTWEMLAGRAGSAAAA